jgi:hypothetical protein
VGLRTSGREHRPRELHAIIVDAIDDRAMKFYRSFGFVSLSPATQDACEAKPNENLL